MARIPLLNEDDPDTPEDARALLEGMAQQYGWVPNIFRVMANHPELASRFSALARVSWGHSLTQKETELVYTTSTMVNACHY
jgi:hypothetical protein